LKLEKKMNKNLQLLNIGAPGADLDAYIQSVGTMSILSVEEEKEIAERLFFDGDVEAARQLVLSNLRFVIHIAKSYQGYGLPFSDIIQEGNVGLMKAVKRYDPTKGVRLVSYAVHWIKAEIHEFVIKNWRIVKIATTKPQRKLFFNLRSMKSGTGILSLKEANAIAKDLGVSLKDVQEMEGRLGNYDTTFDAPAGDNEENNYSPALYLEAKGSNPEEEVAYERDGDSANLQLIEAIKQLDERSQDILKSRWLSDEKPTLHDLAAKYDVSAERIRQIENSAMKKIKTMIAT
jgi:RNA polymerase sigma-32 factor